MKANPIKIKEYDVVRIKASGVVGTIVDIYNVKGKDFFTVEDDTRNSDGGFDLYDCTKDEIEKVEVTL